MKDHYDFSNGERNHYTKRLRENGCKITVTRGEGEDKRVIKEYFRTPEEIAKSVERRKANRVQA